MEGSAHLSSGYFASPATKAGCPIQAALWLEWDTTALDAPFLSLGAKQTLRFGQDTAKIAMDPRPGGPVVKISAQPGTRISCHAALDEAARAPFSKERRMKFAKATKFHRKSGEGLGDGSPRLWSASGARTIAESVSQPSRAGLKFGYRPYGPGSDSRSIFEFP